MRTRRRQSRLDRGHRSPSIYSRTEPQKNYRKLNWLLYLILTLLVGAFLYLIFISPVLKIDNITVNDTKFIQKDSVIGKVNELKNSNIFNNNLLTISNKKIKTKIGEIEGVKEVKISKKFPHSLSITVTETTPMFVWSTIEKKYLVDESGEIYGNYEEKYKDFPIVYDSKNIPAEVGKKVVSESFPEFIRDINNEFSNMTSAKIARIEVPEITSEIKVNSDKNWFAYFDTTRTAKNQLVSLVRVLNEAKSKNKKIEYVDLRIDNRIFYK